MNTFNTAMGDIQIQPIQIRESLVKVLNIVESVMNWSWIQLMIINSHSKFYGLKISNTYSNDSLKHQKEQTLNNDHRA